MKDDDDHLISPKSFQSWLTLQEAAKVRQFTPILDIGKEIEDNESPKILYHCSCRSIFTIKRALIISKENLMGTKLKAKYAPSAYASENPVKHKYILQSDIL